MRNKFLFVFGLIIISVFLIPSCKSQPPFSVEETLPASSLSAKTAYLGIYMAEWNRTYFPLMDAGIYNAGLNEIADEYNARQKEKVDALQVRLSDYYKSAYSAEMVNSSYTIKDEKYDLTYFTKANDGIKQEIADICRQNNTEYALVIIGQMATLGVGGFGINGSNRLGFQATLFDKDGKLVVTGKANSSAAVLKSRDVDRFISFFDEAEENLKSMINAMGG